MMYSAVLIEVI
nr:unnamed protein product [Callosobruchus chinensis]